MFLLCLYILINQAVRFRGIHDGSILVPQVLSEAIPVGFKSNNVREASDVLMNFGRKCYVAVGIRIRVYIVQLTYEHLVAFLTPDKTRDVQADALVLVIVPVRTTVQIAGHLILHFFRTEA